MKDNNILKNIFFFLIFLILVAAPIYLAYKILLPNIGFLNKDNKQEETIEENNQESDTKEITQEEVIEGPHYEEIFQEIDGQMAYIAVPTNIDNQNPPSIVIYSHGSITYVTNDTTDEFIIDLQKYGERFTKSNYIFAASNQHGANWGSTTAVEDTKNMFDWITTTYSTSEKIYLLGYSMGGLVTMNFATKYPEYISKIALLAPTTYPAEWNQDRVNELEDVPIQIWHGNKDVNVPYSMSTSFVNKLKSLGKEVTLITLEGKTHWDIHTEYMEDILNFYISN